MVVGAGGRAAALHLQEAPPKELPPPARLPPVCELAPHHRHPCRLAAYPFPEGEQAHGARGSRGRWRGGRAARRPGAAGRRAAAVPCVAEYQARRLPSPHRRGSMDSRTPRVRRYPPIMQATMLPVRRGSKGACAEGAQSMPASSRLLTARGWGGGGLPSAAAESGRRRWNPVAGGGIRSPAMESGRRRRNPVAGDGIRSPAAESGRRR